MRTSIVSFDNIYARAHRDRELFHDDLKFHPNAREAASCVVDGNSVVRNSVCSLDALSALPVLRSHMIGLPVATLVSGSMIAGGILGVPIGLSSVRDSYKRGKASLACGDIEGVAHQTLYGSLGLSYAALSGVSLADAVMGIQGAAVPAMTAAISGIGLAMYGGLALYGANGLRKTRAFGNELQQKKEQGEFEALQWLHSQITLDPAEIAKIERMAINPACEVAKQLQKKWNAFELRTDPVCGKMVREKLPGLVKNFDLQKAQNLIEEVEKANFKQQVKYALLILIALVGAVSFVALILTTGPVSPVLFAVAAALWLTVDSSRLHNYIGEKCWTWHRKEKERELPCQTPLIA